MHFSKTSWISKPYTTKHSQQIGQMHRILTGDKNNDHLDMVEKNRIKMGILNKKKAERSGNNKRDIYENFKF